MEAAQNTQSVLKIPKLVLKIPTGNSRRLPQGVRVRYASTLTSACLRKRAEGCSASSAFGLGSGFAAAQSQVERGRLAGFASVLIWPVVIVMRLTPYEQQGLARRAQWYFDCYFGMQSQDSVVFTGDGVDDLDSLTARLTEAIATGNIGVNSRFLCDVGTQYSSWRPFDLEDIAAIRAFYVLWYGNVNKPTVTSRWNDPGGPQAVDLNNDPAAFNP